MADPTPIRPPEPPESSPELARLADALAEVLEQWWLKRQSA